MEIKEWDLYTQEEKKTILNHWWHYYGKLLYSLDELERFNKLLDTNCDDVFTTAICSYTRGYSSQILISAMRQGKVDELFKVLPDTITDDELRNRAYKALCNEFLSEVVGTLNNPEPSIPMSDDEIISQLL